jgi:hypothetical protein
MEVAMTKKDGGPAFPVAPGFVDENQNLCLPLTGMTLRDYFAGQVITGLYSNSMLKPSEPSGYVSAAYEVADAMLDEREKSR